MDIKERVKYIRKNILDDMSQEEFAQSIDISRSNLGNIETGKVNLTERVAKSICKRHKINYLWLMNGQGDPKTDTPEDIFEEIRAEYDLSDDDVDILKEYSEMNSDERAGLRRYIKSLIKAKKEEG